MERLQHMSGADIAIRIMQNWPSESEMLRPVHFNAHNNVAIELAGFKKLPGASHICHFMKQQGAMRIHKKPAHDNEVAFEECFLDQRSAATFSVLIQSALQPFASTSSTTNAYLLVLNHCHFDEYEKHV